MSKPKSINILAAAGAPALDTLPDEWREPIRKLEAAIRVQSTALHASEMVFHGAIDWLNAGAPDAALRLLENGESEIKKLLGT